MESAKLRIAIVFILLFFAKISAAEDIIYSDREIIRNGDFKTSLYTAWHDYWCDIVSFAAKDGDFGMS